MRARRLCRLYSRDFFFPFQLASAEVEYGSTEEQLVLDFFAPADVSAVHADKAEHHGKETQSQAAHEQPAHSLYERWGGHARS